MIWRPCKLLREITEKDQLGNDVPTGDYETIAETECRYTPWSNYDLAIEEREVTKNEQRYVLHVPYDTAKLATHAEIDGVRLRITRISDLYPRWTALQVEVYRA